MISNKFGATQAPHAAATELGRLPELDALRGLAALCVVLGHLVTFNSLLSYFRGVVEVWADGRASVCLFFVLSGFVLALSLERSALKSQDVSAFTIKRFFRIYPLYYFSLLLSGLVFGCTMDRLPTLPDWLTTVLPHGFLDVRQWIGHLTLVSPTINTTWLNPPIWSLAVEMRISLLFPVLVLIFRRCSRPRAEWLTMIAITVAGLVGNLVAGSFLFLPHFALGILLAKHRKTWVPAVESWAWWKKGMAFLLAYLLQSAVGLAATMHIPITLAWLLSGLGSGGLVLLTLGSPWWRRFLNKPTFQFLGASSYGVYLLHTPIAVLFFIGISPQNRWLSSILFMLGTFVVTIGVAGLAYRWIELPFIQWGRKVAKRVSIRLTTPAPAADAEPV